MSKKQKFNPSGLVLTQEQKDILNYDLQPDDAVVIKAFAGTGKTTILQLLSNKLMNSQPDWNILYLAFNKSVQMEAQKKFGPNVEARTTHSIAWVEGRKFSHKLSGNLRLSDIKPIIEKDLYKDVNVWKQLQLVSDILINYICNEDKEFGPQHLSPNAREIFFSNMKKEEFVKRIVTYLKAAKKIWTKMIDPNDKEVPMLHDGYLKLYQLSKPDLSRYDVLLVDEFQDLNSVTLNIIQQQKGIKIFTGDSWQKIYGFRKSIDATDKIKPTKMFYLSHSFRFGKNIADMANLLLSRYKNEKVPLVGTQEKDEIVDDLMGTGEKFTVLTRTNAILFAYAADYVGMDYKLGVVGGSGGIDFDTIMDVYNLKRGQNHLIKSKFIRYFDSYTKMMDYAKETEDPEIIKLKCIVDQHDMNIPSLIEKIKNSIVPLDKADIILSTAHKSKGLEFNCVVLADDFVELYEKDDKDIHDEDINLLYVAATRAIRKLQLNESFKGLFKKMEEEKMETCDV